MTHRHCDPVTMDHIIELRKRVALLEKQLENALSYVRPLFEQQRRYLEDIAAPNVLGQKVANPFETAIGKESIVMDATEKLAQMMTRCGLATGHCDAMDDLIFELEKQIKNMSNAISDAQGEIAQLQKEIEAESGRSYDRGHADGEDIGYKNGYKDGLDDGAWKQEGQGCNDRHC